MKKPEINITECDSSDYSVNVEREIKNDSKQIMYIMISGPPSRQAEETPKKREVEQCITVSDERTSNDLYFKIRNCDNLFKHSSLADCSLVIKNHIVASHKKELTIGPFINDYEVLQRTNNKGVKVNQSNMQGITVVTPEEFYKAKIEGKHYLKLEW